MEKIKELLKQIGGTDELANQLTTILNEHVETQRNLLQTEYKEKLNQAKKVCVEQVEAYKKDLARKVQIFFESRSEKIESQMAKQVAIKESEADSKLKNIKALLEGVQLNGQSNSDPQDLQKKFDELKNQLVESQKVNATLTEERNIAVARANRAVTIANKAIERNKSLVLENKKPVQAPPVPTPAPAPATPTAPKPTAPIQESASAPTVVAPKGGQSQVPNAVSTVTVAKPTQETPSTPGDAWDPASIASQLDEE